MDSRAFWEKIYGRFDPDEPARTPAWRVERPYSPAARVLSDIRRPFGMYRYLLYGTVGSGKTTELLWLGQQRASDDIVITLDLQAHFEKQVRDPAALEHLQPWEVLMLVGLAVYHAGDRLGRKWSGDDHKRLTDALQSLLGAGTERKVDVAKLAGSVVAAVAAPVAAGLATYVGVDPSVLGGALTTAGAVAQTFTWELPIGLPGRPQIPDQDDRAHRLLNAVNHLIGALQRDRRPITLIIDGLDQIKRRETAAELFIGSSLLGELACRATVIAAPISLQHLGLAGQVKSFVPVPLANFPVLAQDDPRQEGPGVSPCVAVWRTRTADLDPGQARFPEPLLRRLAWCSGGRMRDYIRLIRMVAELAWDRDLAVADEAVIDAAIRERRLLVEEGLNQRHLTLLRQVVQDPRHLLPDDERTPELLTNLWLLPYPNESIWWFPHPLLTLNLLPL